MNRVCNICQKSRDESEFRLETSKACFRCNGILDEISKERIHLEIENSGLGKRKLVQLTNKKIKNLKIKLFEG